jgi:hypothetical protein
LPTSLSELPLNDPSDELDAKPAPNYAKTFSTQIQLRRLLIIGSASILTNLFLVKILDGKKRIPTTATAPAPTDVAAIHVGAVLFGRPHMLAFIRRQL